MDYKKKVNKLYTELKIEKGIFYLENLIEKDNSNIDLHIDYVQFLIRTMYYGDSNYIGLDHINKFYNNLKFDIRLLLLKSYLEILCFGNIEFNTLKIICDNQNNGYSLYDLQLYFLEARYYMNLNKNKYIYKLENSIKLDSKSSLNYIYLARETKNSTYAKIAIKNIIKVYNENEESNLFDFEDLINENLRGVYITSVNLDALNIEFG